MPQNLPICVPLHPASYGDLRRVSPSTRRAIPIPQSLVGNRTSLTQSRLGEYDPNPGDRDSPETSTSYTIDLGSPRWVSAYRLDYLQEQKLDAYRRGSQLQFAGHPVTFPAIDIYV
jgi:hypothetical protein